MEEKKNTVLVVIVAILFGRVGGYFISRNYTNKNEAYNQSNTRNETITINQYQTTIEDNT